jgi:hypothetical protein
MNLAGEIVRINVKCMIEFALLFSRAFFHGGKGRNPMWRMGNWYYFGKVVERLTISYYSRKNPSL